MKTLPLALLAGLALAICLAPGARADMALDSCPTLPGGSGLTWSYEGGTDFGVCYARLSGNPGIVIGIYFGNEPDFDPARATPLGSGNIAGAKVVWYRRDAASGVASLAVQTIVLLNKGYIAHVWVNADTQAQLQQRLGILQRIAFK